MAKSSKRGVFEKEAPSNPAVRGSKDYKSLMSSLKSKEGHTKVMGPTKAKGMPKGSC